MKDFVSQFTKEHVYDEALVRRIGNDFFLVQPELAKTLQKIKLPPLSAGLFIGRMNEKTSKPGIDLLQMLARTDAKKAWVNDKGAWMFVCKRPVLAESITKCDAKKNELVLVLNRYNECLGHGQFTGKDIKHYFDIGDFLRRERGA